MIKNTSKALAFSAALSALVMTAGAYAAGADLGQAEKQPTNWTCFDICRKRYFS